MPQPDRSGSFDLTDEHFVANLANDLFREGPRLTEQTATQAEHLDSVPGRAANHAADLAGSDMQAFYRSDPTWTRNLPVDAIPYAQPGTLGLPASRSSSFLLRSAPIGAPLPAELTEPWRHMALDPWMRAGAPPVTGLVPHGLTHSASGVAPFAGGVVQNGGGVVPNGGGIAPNGGGIAPNGGGIAPSTMVPEPPLAPRALNTYYFLTDTALYEDHSASTGLDSIGPHSTRHRSTRLGDAPVPRNGAHRQTDPGSLRTGGPYRTGGLRDDFPALNQQVHGKRLVWLDNAATTQKPQCVIDRLRTFYEHDNSNVHRGAHELAARATDAYEGARAKVAAFLGAASPEEIIFLRGTTEAINLVAQSYGRSAIGQGDEIVLTTLEHHSNIVPWQMLAEEKGASLKPVRITDRGDVLLDHYAQLLGPRTRIVAISHVSNALGTILPVDAMAAMARSVGAIVVVDGAQGVPHLPVDVQALGADFYAFSGHKLYGPTGVGALWGRRELLESMPPWQGGGSMIKTVTFESSTWHDLPYKFEAGTGTIGPAVGLGTAIDYVSALGLPHIAAHEQVLLAQGTDALRSIPRVRLIGTSAHKAGVMSFVLEDADVSEVGRFLDSEGIAVRAGHHCAQPALRHFGLDATVRPSIGLYNTPEDIEALAAAVWKAAKRL